MPGSSGPGSGGVTRSTLRQQIVDALRDEILAGRLEPGRSFTVKEIAEQYGVSATPVREALVDLSAQGLLESDQHRGFKVYTYSLDDYRDMLTARTLVTDGIFGALAEERPGRVAVLSDSDEERLAALAGVRRRGEEAERAACAGDLTVLIGYDLRYWRELCALLGNSYLAEFLDRLRVRSWVCTVQHLRRFSDLRGHLWSGYTELVDALCRRDIRDAIGVLAAYNAHSLALADRFTAP